jgi:hypothetical protein
MSGYGVSGVVDAAGIADPGAASVMAAAHVPFGMYEHHIVEQEPGWHWGAAYSELRRPARHGRLWALIELE